jgi:short-subunit dehydrogenase
MMRYAPYRYIVVAVGRVLALEHRGGWMTGLFLSIGAGPGIGLSTALRFASEGFDVVLAARNADRLAELAQVLKRVTTAAVETVVVDCSDSVQVAALVQRYAQTLEVVHYNAAAVRAQTLHAQDLSTIRQDIDTDITGAIVAAKQAAQAMIPRGHGTILFTGGVFGVVPNSHYFTLSVGKAGLRAAVQAMFPELAAHGVHSAILTIAAGIAPQSKDAESVSEAFWNLYEQPRAEWEWEANYP